jgi:hypothetical protein
MIDSRQLENRNEIQERLKQTLREVNADYADAIASDFTVTLGDEFQGVLLDPAPLFEITARSEMRMYPVKIRFGIGFGTLGTEIARASAIGADGPAYYSARRAVEEIKKEENRKRGQKTNMMIASDAASMCCEPLMNAVFAMLALCNCSGAHGSGKSFMTCSSIGWAGSHRGSPRHCAVHVQRVWSVRDITLI